MTRERDGDRDEERAIIDALRKPGALPGATSVEEPIQTHVSTVLLAGDRAWKLKRHVNRGFLDFTTVEARRRDSLDEVRLNRRLAPEIYLGAWPIVDDGSGAHVERAEAPSGPVVDWIVEMRRLPANGMLDRALEDASRRATIATLLERFAVELAAFHANAETGAAVDACGAIERIEARVRDNLARLARYAPYSSAFMSRLSAGTLAWLARVAPALERRRGNGRVRDGHGDLHARNLCIVDDRLVAYDCLEFSSGLRCVDVASDVGFLAMDLEARGHADLARRFVDAYVEASGDAKLLEVEPFFRLHYAVIRAMVEAIRLTDPATDASRLNEIRGLMNGYAALAAGYLVEPALVVMTGLPATGKSSAARLIAAPLRAEVVRSDEVRKRLARVAPTQRGGAELYDDAHTRATYDGVRDETERALSAGRNAIVDAANTLRWQRSLFMELARRRDVPFVVVETTADEAAIARRMAGRAGDATEVSDATMRVYDLMRAAREPLDDVPNAMRLTTESAPDDAIALRVADALLTQ